MSETGQVKPELNVVILTYRYHSDFGGNKTEILEWVRDHMGSKEKLDQFQALIQKKGSLENVKVKYITYDWGHNNKD